MTARSAHSPDLVIFDCDGVLVDSEPATNEILSANLAQHGLAIPPSEVNRLFIGGTMHSVGETARQMGANLPETWLADINATVFARLQLGVPVIDGIISLIDACEAAGIAMAVASNGPMEKMAISLRPSGLLERLEGRIYSGHNHRPKPAPDMLLQIMKDYGTSPDRTVMIDDMPAGWLAAQAAGVHCFAYVAESDASWIGDTGAVGVTSMDQIRLALNLP